jgi:hypothetical protein
MRGALVPTMLEPRCQPRSEISMAGCGPRITASPRSVTTWLAGSLMHRPFFRVPTRLRASRAPDAAVTLADRAKATYAYRHLVLVTLLR